MPAYFIWLGVTIAAALVEAAVPSLISIWFVPGGLAAVVVSLLGGPLWLQALIFVLVSAVALAVTRPLARRLQGRGATATNADMALGKTALVTETIDDVQGTGRVKVQGNSWSARSVNGAPIPQGRSVRVLRIEGVKLIVEENRDGNAPA